MPKFSLEQWCENHLNVCDILMRIWIFIGLGAVIISAILVAWGLALAR